jgi:hypothetical protein
MTTVTVNFEKKSVLHVVLNLFKALGLSYRVEETPRNVMLRPDIHAAVQGYVSGDRSDIIPISSIDDLQKSMGL